MEQFGFQQRQVDIRRAFRSAGFAGETIAERLLEFSAVKAATHASSLKHSTNRIGSSARRHDFFARGDVSGAHGGGFLAAAAAAIALLKIRAERAILGSKCEPRLERQLEIAARRDTQVFIDMKTSVVDDLARVEEIVRIKRGFDFGHDRQKILADLFAHKFGSRDADAMFAGE